MGRFLTLVWPQERVPEGKIFKGAKAQEIIDEWKGEQQLVLKKQGDFIAAAKRTENRVRVLTTEVKTASKEVNKAHKGFNSVKTPVHKARWGRRLILATELHSYVRESHQLLTATVERIKDAIEDGRLVVRLVDNQIKDAQMYYEINGQVQLVGKALAAARNQHAMPEMQYQDLEASIEQVEASLSAKSDEEIIAEAEKLLAAPKEKNDE